MNEIGFFETEKKPVSGMTFAAYTADFGRISGRSEKKLFANVSVLRNGPLSYLGWSGSGSSKTNRSRLDPAPREM
jgi:hypothetical protein